MIEIDGAAGEGGGQLLRTSLTLSVLTGQAFRMTRIRARRSRPGLQRQHLAAVDAARRISAARIEGAEVDSQTLLFEPNRVRAGSYEFAIGTAGSSTLVLQTILLPLMLAQSPSSLRVVGGTHNLAAPPYEFLARAYLPLLARMGARVTLELERWGFYPRGGGEILARVEPGRLEPLSLTERGVLRGIRAEATVAALPRHIAERELGVAARQLALSADCLELRELPRDMGPGNVLTITVSHEHVTEVFTGFGERGVPAESVASAACRAARDYLAAEAATGPHLADQLLLPLAIAGGGKFTTTELTSHFASNAGIIARFLPLSVTAEERGSGWLVSGSGG